MCVWGGVCEGQRSIFGVMSRHAIYLLLRQGLSQAWSSPIREDWLASEP